MYEPRATLTTRSEGGREEFPIIVWHSFVTIATCNSDEHQAAHFYFSCQLTRQHLSTEANHRAMDKIEKPATMEGYRDR